MNTGIYIGAEEIAARLGMDLRYVRRAIIPQMEHIKLGRYLRVTEEAYAAWIESRTHQPRLEVPESHISSRTGKFKILVGYGDSGKPIYVTARSAEEAEEMAKVYYDLTHKGKNRR